MEMRSKKHTIAIDIFLMMVAWFMVFSGSASAIGKRTMEKNLFALVDELTVAGIARPSIERLAGVHLRLASETDVSNSYVGDGFRLKDVAVTSLDYREATPANPLHPGPILIVELHGGCISRDMVFDHYTNLRLFDAPHGHSLDEETSYSRVESWGQLRFGFAERSPDCLSSVVFDARSRIDPQRP